MAFNDDSRAGWYRDPQTPGFDRYWNGVVWEGPPRLPQSKPSSRGRDPLILTDSQRRKLTLGGVVFLVVFAFFTIDGYDLALSGIILAIASPFILIAVVLWLLWRAGNKNTLPQPGPTVQSEPRVMAPGWYPDQVDPTLNRWWDGMQWASATLPKSTA